MRKQRLWFIIHSIKFVGIKKFITGVVPAWKKWRKLWEEDNGKQKI